MILIFNFVIWEDYIVLFKLVFLGLGCFGGLVDYVFVGFGYIVGVVNFLVKNKY